MLDRVVLKNFKTHRHTEIALGRLTVLVGPNGAGKSSVLTALDCLCTAPLVGLGEVFSGSRAGDVVLRKGAQALLVEMGGPTETTVPWLTKVKFAPTSGGHWELLSPDNITYSDNQIEYGLRTEIESVRHEFRHCPRSGLLRLEPRELAAPAPPMVSPRLGPDGAGLAAVVAHIKLNDTEGLERLTQDLRRVVPAVRQLRVGTKQVEIGQFREAITTVAYELLVDFANAQGVPAHAVSEGTLLLIGLLTVLHGPNRPDLLLLDDLDRGLHPRAQRELIAILRRLLEVHPELQIVATSHSPYLVDELRPEEVWVCALDAEGISHCRNLATHPRAERLLEVLTTGELLSAEGDDWVLAEDPVNANA